MRLGLFRRRDSSDGGDTPSDETRKGCIRIGHTFYFSSSFIRVAQSTFNPPYDFCQRKHVYVWPRRILTSRRSRFAAPNLHLDLPQYRYDLLWFVFLHRHIHVPCFMRYSLTSVGTDFPGRVTLGKATKRRRKQGRC